MDRNLAARLAVAALLLPTSTLSAASVLSPMGATSRATIRLTVSVRPRVHVAMNTPGGQWEDGSASDLCVRSASPGQRFTVSLHSEMRDSGTADSSAKPPADSFSTTSRVTCTQSVRTVLDGASIGQGRSPLLVLVAPD